MDISSSARSRANPRCFLHPLPTWSSPFQLMATCLLSRPGRRPDALSLTLTATGSSFQRPRVGTVPTWTVPPSQGRPCIRLCPPVSLPGFNTLTNTSLLKRQADCGSYRILFTRGSKPHNGFAFIQYKTRHLKSGLGGPTGYLGLIPPNYTPANPGPSRGRGVWQWPVLLFTTLFPQPVCSPPQFLKSPPKCLLLPRLSWAVLSPGET